MKELRFRAILIVGAVALSLYLLYPTYKDYQNNNNISNIISQLRDSINTASPNFTNEEIESLLEFKEDSIRIADPDIKKAREKRVKLGLDLQGGMYLVMEVNTAKLLERLA